MFSHSRGKTVGESDISDAHRNTHLFKISMSKVNAVEIAETYAFAGRQSRLNVNCVTTIS